MCVKSCTHDGHFWTVYKDFLIYAANNNAGALCLTSISLRGNLPVSFDVRSTSSVRVVKAKYAVLTLHPMDIGRVVIHFGRIGIAISYIRPISLLCIIILPHGQPITAPELETFHSSITAPFLRREYVFSSFLWSCQLDITFLTKGVPRTFFQLLLILFYCINSSYCQFRSFVL